jgi:single-stranded DNA-binding protein
MDTMNLTVVGRVAADPKFFGDGDKHANLRLASSHYNKGEKSTTWLNVAVWNFASMPDWLQAACQKGKLVCVSGTFTTREYEAKDGTTKVSLEVRSSQVTPLDQKGSNSNSSDDGVPF